MKLQHFHIHNINLDNITANMSYYRTTMPKVNDVVIVTVKNITDGGVYCNLVEYNNMEGFIISTEVDKGKGKGKGKKNVNPKKLFKPNEYYPTIVISVDTTKNRVDLSFKRLKQDDKHDDRTPALELFARKEKLYKLCIDMVSVTNMEYGVVMEHTFWKFMDDKNIIGMKQNYYCDSNSDSDNNSDGEEEKEDVEDDKEEKNDVVKEDNVCDNLVAFYNMVLEDPTIFVKSFSDEYADQIQIFITNIHSRTKATNMCVKRDFDLIVFDVDSITKLKYILTHNLAIQNSKIYFEAPGKYRIEVTGPNLDACNNLIETVLSIIINNMKNIKCMFKTHIADDDILQHKQMSIKPLMTVV